MDIRKARALGLLVASLVLGCAAPAPKPVAPLATAPPIPEFPWTCAVTEADGRHDAIVVAVKDEGATFKVAMGSKLTGPFNVIEETNGSAPFRKVLEAKDLADPDLHDAFTSAGVKVEDVAKLTAYGVGMRGGWSVGMAVFSDPRGKVLGQFGWRMRVGVAAPCGDDAPYAVLVARALGKEDLACTGGDADACDRLGEAYAEGDGDALAADAARSAVYFQRALTLHQRACDSAEPAGCSAVADAYDSGRRGVARDEARAFAIYDHACEHILKPDACFRVGAGYEQGAKAPEDYVRAARIYNHACTGSDLDACEALARLYAEGQGVAKDEAHAAELRDRVCASGIASVCNGLGVQYDKGKGVTRDAARAAILYKKACDAGEVAACVNLGELTAEGRGVARDVAGAVALFTKSCAASSGAAPFGCAGLGLAHEKGLGVPVSRTKAIDLYRSGCKGGADWFCKRLTQLGAKP
jgi:TPR repeat protein